MQQEPVRMTQIHLVNYVHFLGNKYRLCIGKLDSVTKCL